MTRGASPGQDWVGGGQVSVPTTPRASEMLPALSAKVEVEDDSASALEPRVPWYRQRSLQLVLAGYASIAFLMNFLEELTPIFASAPYRLVRCAASSCHALLSLIPPHDVTCHCANHPPLRQSLGCADS